MSSAKWRPFCPGFNALVFPALCTRPGTGRWYPRRLTRSRSTPAVPGGLDGHRTAMDAWCVSSHDSNVLDSPSLVPTGLSIGWDMAGVSGSVPLADLYIDLETLQLDWTLAIQYRYPDNKVHGANMGPLWGRHEPCYQGNLQCIHVQDSCHYVQFAMRRSTASKGACRRRETPKRDSSLSGGHDWWRRAAN